MRTRATRFAVIAAAVLSLAACSTQETYDNYGYIDLGEGLPDLVPPGGVEWAAYGDLNSLDVEEGRVTVTVLRSATVVDGEVAVEPVDTVEHYSVSDAAFRCGVTAGRGYAIPLTDVDPGGRVVVWGNGEAGEGDPRYVFLDNQRACDKAVEVVEEG